MNTTLDRGPTPPTSIPDAAADGSRPRTRRRSRRTSPATRITLTAVLAIAAAYFLFPVYWLLVAATKSTGDLFGTSGLVLNDPQLLSNLRGVLTFDDGIFLRWVGNSLLYAGVSSVVATLLALAGGYCMAKFAFRGREALFNVFLAGVMIPGTALALPLFLLMSDIGLIDTVWAVLIPSLVSPFGLYLSRIYATASVPDSLLEAARIDGAGEFRIFATLGLRLMAPAGVTILLFQFIGAWNNYFLPLVMLSDQRLYPLTLGLVTWNSVSDRHPELYEMTVAGALLSVVPLMVAIIVLQRHLRPGLTEGSVKG
ncbi:carbohydrate ABC transporter permease [Brachybacterium sacelli]|uniref:Multiple sugar transport system permease protein n=1 Tax=Brachybacterium sacelli TaxID=173364 RepID=A0ABS4WYJ4_9MICO|nr:carbohydrate ABC transporter permease [Brachybacterium sacelli]MBP2381272.1 multiple sugar transport system permease protein [Brachybacterium sacelli]